MLKNKYTRLAISKSFDKKAFTETVLNNGSLPAEGIVPLNFAKGTDGKDFRKENGNLANMMLMQRRKIGKKPSKN